MNKLDEIEKVWGKIPKILVGAPHWDRKDYILERYAKRIKELNYPNYDILIADTSKDPIHLDVLKGYDLPAVHVSTGTTARTRVRDARNAVRAHALEHDYDFIFFYDTDIIAPKDILLELLQWGKKVVGGWYYVGVPSFARPVITRNWINLEQQSPDRMAIYKEMAENRLMKSFIGAMGVQLIHREILEKFKFFVLDEMHWFADSFFFYALERKGIQAYTDTEMLCPHFTSDWAEVKDK